MSNLRFPVTRFYRTFRYAHIFRNTSRVCTNGMPDCVCPWGCPDRHLAYTAHPQGHTGMGRGDTGMGKVFTLAHVGWWNIVQVRILHRLHCTLHNPRGIQGWGGGYRNGESIYTCTCGVVEYRPNENVTPAACRLLPMPRTMTTYQSRNVKAAKG